MIYLINAIYSILYFYLIKKYKRINFIIFFPIFFIWLIILGFQYGVGTDYFNYLRIYKNTNNIQFLYFSQKEYIFYYFLKLLNFFSKNGQLLFISVSFLENIIFYIFLKKLVDFKLIKIKEIYVFIFIFLCFGTSFYNQMNTLRQYFNIYLFSLAVIYLLFNKKIKYALLILIGSYIHKSILYLLPIIGVKFFIKKFKISYLYFLLIFSCCFICFPVEDIFIYIVKYIPRYNDYIESRFFSKIHFQAQITKIIFIPFYFEAIKLIKKEKNENIIMLLKIGLLSFMIRIISLKNIMITRMSEYFIILSIFPIYYLIIYYYKNQKKMELYCLISMIFGLFLIKILVFPRGEYLYNSYFFN